MNLAKIRKKNLKSQWPSTLATKGYYSIESTFEKLCTAIHAEHVVAQQQH
jgi:hypothetical protein